MFFILFVGFFISLIAGFVLMTKGLVTYAIISFVVAGLILLFIILKSVARNRKNADGTKRSTGYSFLDALVDAGDCGDGDCGDGDCGSCD